MDISPTTCRTLEQYYHVNSNTLDKQYKDVLSDYRTWSELEHADEWLVFPDNVGRNLAIDETSMSNGELRTIVTNRDRHGKDQCLVAIVKGVKSEDVINALKHIPEVLLNMVEEVTLDLSDSMRKIVRTCFPKAMRVIDRFRPQKDRITIPAISSLAELRGCIDIYPEYYDCLGKFTGSPLDRHEFQGLELQLISL